MNFPTCTILRPRFDSIPLVETAASERANKTNNQSLAYNSRPLAGLTGLTIRCMIQCLTFLQMDPASQEVLFGIRTLAAVQYRSPKPEYGVLCLGFCR